MNLISHIPNEVILKHQELKYYILPGKCPLGFEFTEIHNKAFEYWKTFWSKVYADAGSLDAFHPDDFFRQDYIPVIMWKNEIVAMHLYTFFNLKQRSAIHHNYFNFFNEQFFEKLNELKIEYVMSMEFLTVDPKWRKKESFISVAELLSGIGLELFKQSQGQAAIAPARKDVKVHEMAYKFNFDCLVSDVNCRNFDCDLILGVKNKISNHPDNYLNALVQKIWNERIDTTGISKLAHYNIKESA